MMTWDFIHTKQNNGIRGVSTSQNIQDDNAIKFRIQVIQMKYSVDFRPYCIRVEDVPTDMIDSSRSCKPH